MALQPDACPYRRARCHRYGMPLGKTSAVPWFSSMITRILLTPRAAAAALMAGDETAAAAEPGAELGAVGPVGPALQPAARQPTSPPPISRAYTRPRRRFPGMPNVGVAVSEDASVISPTRPR